LSNYIVKVKRTSEFGVPVEADDPESAMDLALDMDDDILEQYTVGESDYDANEEDVKLATGEPESEESPLAIEPGEHEPNNIMEER